METAILLVQCPDSKGIVAKLSELIFRCGGNIIQSDQHTTDPQGGLFFMRIEFCFDKEINNCMVLESEFEKLALNLNAQWQIHYAGTVKNMGILVSKQDHCLYDLLYRWKSGELRINIPFVISNHRDVSELVHHYNIPFYYLPVTSGKKHLQERDLLKIAGDADFLVLARYMQILSEDFLNSYKRDVINIHHSFLPSFKGANPYRQAYLRGVKIIGATAHFVTADLDEGPIIEQAVERVTHRDSEESMKKKGRNLEKYALSGAVGLYTEHRIIRHSNRTIVFN